MTPANLRRASEDEMNELSDAEVDAAIHAAVPGWNGEFMVTHFRDVYRAASGARGQAVARGDVRLFAKPDTERESLLQAALELARAEIRTLRNAVASPPAVPVAVLPEFDPTRPRSEQGLYRKFNVSRTDGTDAPGGKHDGCEYFVLDRTHDKHAREALLAYADSCSEEYPQLAADLRKAYDSGPRLPRDELVAHWRAMYRQMKAFGDEMFNAALAAPPATPGQDAVEARLASYWRQAIKDGEFPISRDGKWMHVDRTTGRIHYADTAEEIMHAACDAALAASGAEYFTAASTPVETAK